MAHCIRATTNTLPSIPSAPHQLTFEAGWPPTGRVNTLFRSKEVEFKNGYRWCSWAEAVGKLSAINVIGFATCE